MPDSLIHTSILILGGLGSFCFGLISGILLCCIGEVILKKKP
jgi:hypothetical protein